LNYFKFNLAKNSLKDGLDYTFLSHRSQISNDKLNIGSKDYIFDLTNTWELNIELINKLIKTYQLKNPNFSEISQQIKNLKNLFDKKDEKRINLAKSRGKILIEKQIIEENRRKIEENNDLYQEQLKETQENVDNKEEYIKIFEKKLKEVEIYVQKHTKNLSNTKYDIYKTFKMNDFIYENTDLLTKKEEFEKENKDILDQIEKIINENKKLNHTQSVNYTKNFNNHELSFKNCNDLIDDDINKNDLIIDSLNTEIKRKSKVYMKENPKINSILQVYNAQIKLIESKNKLLKSSLNNLRSKCFKSKIPIEFIFLIL